MSVEVGYFLFSLCWMVSVSLLNSTQYIVFLSYKPTLFLLLLTLNPLIFQKVYWFVSDIKYKTLSVGNLVHYKSKKITFWL